MCTGYEIAALALAAGGTGATVYSQQDALRKQDREAAAGILRSAELNREANSKVQKNISQLEQSDPSADIAKRQATYLDAIRRAQPAADAALPGAGAASSRFAEDVGLARTDAAADTADTANLMARIDAPGIQRQREGQTLANTASEIGLLDASAQREAFLTKLRAASKVPNPYLSGAGQLAAGAGAGLASNAGGETIWDDGTSMSGFTAAQRRQYNGSAPASRNVNRGRP